MAVEVSAEHIIRCAACDSDQVNGGLNLQGLWYGFCRLCGCRFWDRRA